MAGSYLDGEDLIHFNGEIGNTDNNAQAKTLDELWEIWLKAKKTQEVYEFAKARCKQTLLWSDFPEVVAFFLAAGGRIKE